MFKLNPGDRAPSFSLKDQHGRTVKLSDFKGRKLLLFFYPKAETPGCIKQACAVRDASADLDAIGVACAGISPDMPAEQKKFDERNRLKYPLLSDPDHAVAQAYAVWDDRVRYGKKSTGLTRSSFLIDENGRVAGAWYDVKPEETVPKARALLTR